MQTLISFAALFLTVLLLQLSSGGIGPLDALTGLSAGLSQAEVGLLGSAHFIGFFIGCWWAPRLMGNIGHSRAFATFTALGAMGILAHTLVLSTPAWAAFRIASGICIAGAYTVIEAWLQAKVTNETRARALSSYRMVDMGGSLLSQLMLGFLADLETYLAYNILALICCASLLPLAVTRASPPAVPKAPRLRPALAFARSPLACASVIVAATSSASFRMVGPIYGDAVGLSADQIGLFLGAFIAGGALSQYPVGWLADRFDRRWILIGLSAAAVLVSAISATWSEPTADTAMIQAALFGLTAFPIYSVAAAHAHDFASPEERVELSAALLFFYAAGAIAAPLTASGLIAAFGPGALFALMALAHGILILFGLWRMRARATPEDRTTFVQSPRTSFWIGRLTRKQRDRPPPE